MNSRHIICAALLLAPGAAIADTPSTNYLWYRQSAGVKAVSLPWENVPNGELFPNIAPRMSVTTPTGKVKKSNIDFWECQTLPVGNGRIGGTVFGGDRVERVALNEVSLWSGGPNHPHNGAGYLYGPKAGKDRFGSYQPFGNLYVSFELPQAASENYTRSLNLEDGIARVDFTNAGVSHHRECYVSAPDQVLVYTATADTPGSVTANIALLPYHDVSYSVSGNTIIMSGTLANGQQFEGRMLVRVNGGTVKAVGSHKTLKIAYAKATEKAGADTQQPFFEAEGVPYIAVKDATRLEIIISLATDYTMDFKKDWKGASPSARNEKILKRVSKKKESSLRAAQLADYRRLFRRLSINLGKTDAEVAALPTDERIAAFRKSQHDPELISTIYQYGRYMLICGSRPGNLPINLQGIWNDKVHAPWASDYHNNINLQMCYWSAEVANLSECHMPFLNFIRAMEEPLTRMTKRHFGDSIEGWTTRISQNPWGGGGWTHWNPPVNAWYALHLWDHYAFTHDKKYLKEHAYPILKNICRFWETRLKELGENGKGLMTAAKGKNAKTALTVAEHPELAELPRGTLVSPEGWSHEWGPVEDGCAHDHQLIRELFDITAQAADILNCDREWATALQQKRARIAPDRIGSGGYLQEWIVDRPNMVAGQRHTSHLIGVYPGSTITMAGTPELAKAAMKSLELRGLSGDNRRSWTWPWRTALWARFYRPEQAYSMVSHYITYNLLDNLFGNHPPMQLDGTYGITAGISEMLLQSHAGQIELLPALPEQWSTGSVQGLRARGNLTVNMAWEDGKVTSYMITTTDAEPKPIKVIVNGQVTQMTPNTVKKGKKSAKR